MKKVLFLTGLIALTACDFSESSSKTKAVIGENNLAEAQGENLDVKHGLLTAGDRDCNAFLTGASQVTTALHCIGKDPISFIGFTYKSSSGINSNVVDITFLDDTKDMITYSLDREYSAFYQLSFELDQSKSLKVVGVDHESGNILENSCKVGNLLPENAAFEHRCDTKKKYSGSPLIQNGKVVGLHLGHNPIKNINYALNMSQIFDDKADIVALEVDAELEWPHVRSPHIRSPHIRNPDKTVKVCAVGFTVSAALYYFCQASISSIPASCTAGAVATAGTACGISVATAAATCGVNAAILTKAANACIEQAMK